MMPVRSFASFAIVKVVVEGLCGGVWFVVNSLRVLIIERTKCEEFRARVLVSWHGISLGVFGITVKLRRTRYRQSVHQRKKKLK